MFRVSVRHNSTSPFLKELLQRVDSISTRIQENAVKNNGKKAGAKKVTQSKKASPSESNAAPVAKPAVATTQVVNVANHPMRNQFGQNRDRQGQNRERSTQGGQNRQRNNRPQRDGRKRERQARTPRSRTPEAQEAPKPVKIAPVPLTPSVGGNTFFYGKPVSLVISPSSRTAAVAKKALVDSKYPYQLPKTVIDSVPEYHPNKFVLSKARFAVTINSDAVKNDVANKVAGMPLMIDGGKFAKDKVGQFVNANVSRNGSMGLGQRQSVYDVAMGLRSTKEAFKNAAWMKK